MKIKIKMKIKMKNSLLTKKQGSILFLDYQLFMGATNRGSFNF